MNLKLISPTVSTFPILWHILCNSTVIGYELILRLKASAVNWLLFLPNWMSQNYDLFHPGIQSKKRLIFLRIGLLLWSFNVWVLEYLYDQLHLKLRWIYFIFLLQINKNKGSFHLILNRHGGCTVFLSVLFACLIDLLQLLIIDLV